jgi:hypothetical protein
MKKIFILMAVLSMLIFPSISFAEWTPSDGDAVLKGIAEETNGVKIIRVLQVNASGGVGTEVAVSNFPATQSISDADLWGEELVIPVTFTGASNVVFTNTIRDITITNVSATETLYYATSGTASATDFQILPKQSFSFKTNKTTFNLFFTGSGTVQLHGSYIQ